MTIISTGPRERSNFSPNARTVLLGNRHQVVLFRRIVNVLQREIEWSSQARSINHWTAHRPAGLVCHSGGNRMTTIAISLRQSNAQDFLPSAGWRTYESRCVLCRLGFHSWLLQKSKIAEPVDEAVLPRAERRIVPIRQASCHMAAVAQRIARMATVAVNVHFHVRHTDGQHR